MQNPIVQNLILQTEQCRTEDPPRLLPRRIDEHLAQTQKETNNDLIRRMRQVAFAHVDALQQSGEVRLPE